MFGSAPVSLDEARRLHAWLGRYLRREDSKEARAAIADVEQQMTQQQAPPPPPRDDLPVHYFCYLSRATRSTRKPSAGSPALPIATAMT